MYERAQILAAEEAKYRSNRRESTATALRLKPMCEVPVDDYYPTFLDMLKNVLDGNMEINNYEDSLREMFGIHAYLAFTLDRVSDDAALPMPTQSKWEAVQKTYQMKTNRFLSALQVVTNAVRQLQHCVTERGAIESVELFHQEQRRNGAGGYCRTANKRIAAEMAYQRRSEASLQDENCFKVYIVSVGLTSQSARLIEWF